MKNPALELARDYLRHSAKATDKPMKFGQPREFGLTPTSGGSDAPNGVPAMLPESLAVRPIGESTFFPAEEGTGAGNDVP